VDRQPSRGLPSISNREYFLTKVKELLQMRNNPVLDDRFLSYKEFLSLLLTDSKVISYINAAISGIDNIADIIFGSSGDVIVTDNDNGTATLTTNGNHARYKIPLGVKVLTGSYEQYVIHSRTSLVVEGSLVLGEGSEVLFV